MSKLTEILAKIRRKWAKMRLQPIRVFCFHQVSDTFDQSTMKECDWLQTDAFKRIITDMREQGYVFISLLEAHEKIRRDIFRCNKYAVLTADDGWASLRNIMPWLNDQQIPITLFLNPGYLDGNHFREIETEKYLAEEEVKLLYKQYPLLTIGMHGWEHVDATKQTEKEFCDSIEKSERYLNDLPNYIPYFAYTWGRHIEANDSVLLKNNITPVLIMGGKNYNISEFIDRELLDEHLKY